MFIIFPTLKQTFVLPPTLASHINLKVFGKLFNEFKLYIKMQQPNIVQTLDFLWSMLKPRRILETSLFLIRVQTRESFSIIFFHKMNL